MLILFAYMTPPPTLESSLQPSPPSYDWKLRQPLLFPRGPTPLTDLPVLPSEAFLLVLSDLSQFLMRQCLLSLLAFQVPPLPLTTLERNWVRENQEG